MNSSDTTGMIAPVVRRVASSSSTMKTMPTITSQQAVGRAFFRLDEGFRLLQGFVGYRNDLVIGRRCLVCCHAFPGDLLTPRPGVSRVFRGAHSVQFG